MWLSPSRSHVDHTGSVCVRQASLGEEFRWALSVAVLGYGVTVCVLVLHALGRGSAFSQT